MDNIIINLDDSLRLGGDPLPNITPQSDIISQSDAIVGPAGPQGPQGPAGADGEAATITVGSTTTSAAGTNALVQNSGTSSAAILDFIIPRGDKGETGEQGPQGETGAAGADGEAATITVGSVTTVSSEYPATVTNSGTSSAAVLDFQIPQGIQGETGPAGADGRDGTDGVDGAAATITVGSTTTGAAGTNASVTNSGTSSAAVLEFTIPRGETGATGPAGADGADGADGQAATISVGTTTTLPAGSSATVTNSGTSSAAVFNFGIPKGADGSIEELTSVPKFNAYYNTAYNGFPADTPIPYNTIQVNIGSFTLSGGRVTIPKSGNYLITVQLWTQNNASRSWWKLRRNNNPIGEAIISASGYWGVTAISNIYVCTQGDIIDVIKNGSESVNLNSGSGDKRSTSISIQYIG